MPSTRVKSKDVCLTKRQRTVLKGINAGKTYGAIAADLGLVYETVKAHARNLRKKLRCRNRTQLAVWAERQGEKAL